MNTSRSTESMVYLYPIEVPDWYELTDPNSDRFDRSLRERLAKIRAAGNPKLALVVGSDIDKPFDIFGGEGSEPGIPSTPSP